MASNIVTAGGGCGAATATKSAGLKSWVARQHDKSAALGARTKKRSLDSRAWCDVTSIQAPPARAVAPVVASAPAKNDQRDLQARKEESALSTGRDRMAFLPARKGAVIWWGVVKNFSNFHVFQLFEASTLPSEKYDPILVSVNRNISPKVFQFLNNFQ